MIIFTTVWFRKKKKMFCKFSMTSSRTLGKRRLVRLHRVHTFVSGTCLSTANLLWSENIFKIFPKNVDKCENVLRQNTYKTKCAGTRKMCNYQLQNMSFLNLSHFRTFMRVKFQKSDFLIPFSIDEDCLNI